MKAYFPIILKLSSVSPIHKSGDVNNVSNYHPISIFLSFQSAEILESIVMRCIQPSANSKLCDMQHASRPGRSTLT